jgi:hypothetical protein
MGNFYVHVHMKKCCQETLEHIDRAKAALDKAKGQKTKSSLKDQLGKMPIDTAAKHVPSGITEIAENFSHTDPVERKAQIMCTDTCAQHAAEHLSRGETKEASFWSAARSSIWNVAQQLGSGLLATMVGTANAATPETMNASAPSGKSSMNIDNAVSHLKAHAGKTSTKECAKYVKNAIHAGGVKLTGANAKDLGPNLEAVGFVPVANQATFESFTPTKGDVVVFDAVPKHEFGHAAMFDGEHWVSDYNQNDFYANRKDYENGAFTIYRP